eukprot:gb/GEZN01000384.1/.p1 GENE.gb/GEZN01000384.1/~~gb/GEZN01000384.1/.p1  ORF type:complete len:1453 (+),score=281.10 gb/GEZN01000384.1/:75-4433(+)
MQSCLYSGTVTHQRDREAEHSFTYPVLYFCLDLEELASSQSPLQAGLFAILSKTGLVSFVAEDHLKPSALHKALGSSKAEQVGKLGLLDKVRAVVALKTERKASHVCKVRLLANVRYLGYGFNPISIFYCYDDAGELRYMLLEVSNTPWGETHLYLLGEHSPDCVSLEATSSASLEEDTSAAKFGPYTFQKHFHVSPFMPMADQVYILEASGPGNSLSVDMGTLREPESKTSDVQFQAHLYLRRHSLTSTNLMQQLLRHANMTHATQWWIHREAMQLYEKGVTFFPHPEGSITTFSKLVERLMDLYNLWFKPATRSAIAHTRDGGPTVLQLEARAALVGAQAAQSKLGGTLAVIGSGVAGLSAAYFAQLQSPYNVVLYEASQQLGGHALTYEVLPGLKIDLGFQVYNLTNYPYLCALFRSLKVETIESDMSLSVQRSVSDNPGKHTEWASHGLGTVFPNWTDLRSYTKIMLVKEMLRFNRECPKVLESQHTLGMLSVGQYMQHQGYSQEFLELYLLPSCGAIWSISFDQVMDYPIRSLAGFFANHCLFSLVDRPQWRTLKFRSEDYVNKLASAFVQAGGKIRSNCAVTRVAAVEDTAYRSSGSEPSESPSESSSSEGSTSVEHSSDSDKDEKETVLAGKAANSIPSKSNTSNMPKQSGKGKGKKAAQLSQKQQDQKVCPDNNKSQTDTERARGKQGHKAADNGNPRWLVTDIHDESLVADKVMFACHPQQAAKMLVSRVCPAELVQLAGILQRMPYSKNAIKVHTDESVMPKNRKLWAAWNCHVTTGRGLGSKPIGVTYWMNLLQSLPPSAPNLFVTLNSPEVDPAKVLHSLELEHPILNHSALGARSELQRKNGQLGLFFCGAWAGSGFHEDGIKSAVDSVSLLLGQSGPAIMKFMPEPWHVVSSPPEVPLKYRLLVPALCSYIKGLVLAGHLCLVLPNGQEKHFVGQPRKLVSTESEQVSLFVHKWEFLGSLVWDVDMAMAEGYMQGNWTVTPSLTALVEMMAHNSTLISKGKGKRAPSMTEQLAQKVISAGQLVGESWHHFENLLRRNTESQSVSNIASHYDLGNDMYSLFLDQTMTYSAAFFESPKTSLYQAQLKKLDMILDKARQPGRDQRFKVLEIGCGWASCALRALQRNPNTDWTGVTISEEQLRLGRDRVAEHQLTNSIALKFLDYRHAVSELGEATFDAVVSIEMIEAVGGEFLPHYFETIYRSLKPGGRAVIQAITVPNYRYESYVASSDFIRQHIFPGGELVSVEKCTQCFPINNNYRGAARVHGEPLGALLRVVHLQEMGQHYATTLLRWLHTWEQKKSELLALGISDVSWRLWKYYFCYCAGGFLAGHIDVVQMVLERPLDTAEFSVTKPLIQAPNTRRCPPSPVSPSSASSRSSSSSSSSCPVVDKRSSRKLQHGLVRRGVESAVGFAARTVFPVLLGLILLLSFLLRIALAPCRQR